MIDLASITLSDQILAIKLDNGSIYSSKFQMVQYMLLFELLFSVLIHTLLLYYLLMLQLSFSISLLNSKD